MRVLFFARLKELSGTAEMEREVASPMSPAEFWEWLFAQHPALRGRCDQVRLARNGVYLAEEEKLHPDDEVALIPPVSGG